MAGLSGVLGDRGRGFGLTAAGRTGGVSRSIPFLAAAQRAVTQHLLSEHVGAAIQGGRTLPTRAFDCGASSLELTDDGRAGGFSTVAIKFWPSGDERQLNNTFQQSGLFTTIGIAAAPDAFPGPRRHC